MCLFPSKVFQKDEKVQKEKNEIEDVFTYALFIFILYFIRSLGHMVVQMAIYVARKLYFILAISNVSIFHPSFNDIDHFDTILKCWDQINPFKRPKIRLTHNVKVKYHICNLP